jgi:hypothetical protein
MGAGASAGFDSRTAFPNSALRPYVAQLKIATTLANETLQLSSADVEEA